MNSDLRHLTGGSTAVPEEARRKVGFVPVSCLRLFIMLGTVSCAYLRGGEDKMSEKINLDWIGEVKG